MLSSTLISGCNVMIMRARDWPTPMVGTLECNTYQPWGDGVGKGGLGAG